MSEMKREWWTKATAVFQPKRLDTLKPEWRPLIGQRIPLEYNSIIESGQYVGHESWFYNGKENGGVPVVGWMPEEDLKDIRVIEDEK